MSLLGFGNGGANLPEGSSYNADIWIWVPARGSLSDSICWGTPSGGNTNLCHWFPAMQVNFTGGGALHVGPEHGVSYALPNGSGNGPDTYQIQYCGYIGGVHTENCAGNLAIPIDSWVRYRVWAVGNSGSNITYVVAALINGNETQVGYVTYPGWIAQYYFFDEVRQVHGPCQTNWPGAYFWGQTYRPLSGGAYTLGSATAGYNDTCNGTGGRGTWYPFSAAYAAAPHMWGGNRLVNPGGSIW